jgi:RimJ/RimL family protein N-acetyltransferase
MTSEPGVVHGDGLTLVPVRRGDPAKILAGDLGGLTAAPGWPHADTAPGLSFADHGGASWLVVDESGHVVGELGTKGPPGPDGTVEIGYGLAGPSRGRGIGTRAVAALLSWLDEQPDVRMVEAHVRPDNTASVRVLQRLGFEWAGHAAGEDLYRRPREHQVRCT